MSNGVGNVSVGPVGQCMHVHARNSALHWGLRLPLVSPINDSVFPTTFSIKRSNTLPQTGVDSDNRTEGEKVDVIEGNADDSAMGVGIVGGCIGAVVWLIFIFELSQGSPLDSHGSMFSSPLS